MDKDILNAKILIVDDEPGNILVLERMLKFSGFKNINSTQNGQEVAELYNSFSPDLILLDLMMPNFDGFDVMK